MGFLHLAGVFMLLGATVLLIVVSVSTPIWNAVYFLEAGAGEGMLKMGQWGLCVGEQCTSSRLGYNLNFLVQSGDNEWASNTIRRLSYALVLNPIAAGFSLLALLFALGTHFILGLIGSLFAFFAFLVTLIALAIDLGLFVTAHRRLENQGLEARYGNALWMVVAACAAQLIASFLVCCTRSRNNDERDVRDAEYGTAPRRGLFGRRRNNNSVVAQDPAYAGTSAPMTEKRHWWNRNRQPAATAY